MNIPRELLENLVAIIDEELLPNAGGIVIRDFGRLNQSLMAARVLLKESASPFDYDPKRCLACGGEDHGGLQCPKMQASSLETKREYYANNQGSNYAASCRLEGIEPEGRRLFDLCVSHGAPIGRVKQWLEERLAKQEKEE